MTVRRYVLHRVHGVSQVSVEFRGCLIVEASYIDGAAALGIELQRGFVCFDETSLGTGDKQFEMDVTVPPRDQEVLIPSAGRYRETAREVCRAQVGSGNKQSEHLMVIRVIRRADIGVVVWGRNIG